MLVKYLGNLNYVCGVFRSSGRGMGYVGEVYGCCVLVMVYECFFGRDGRYEAI